MQFYDLYSALEDKEKALISNMPKRAAYSLASRKGDVNKKIEIIKEHHDSPPEEIIRTVQEAFPLKENDRCKSSKKVNDIELLKEILPKIRKLRERKSLEKILSLVEGELSKPIEKTLIRTKWISSKDRASLTPVELDTTFWKKEPCGASIFDY